MPPWPFSSGESTRCRSLGGWEGQKEAESVLSGSPTTWKNYRCSCGHVTNAELWVSPDLQNLHFNKILRQCMKSTHNVRSTKGEQHEWDMLAALADSRSRKEGGPPFSASPYKMFKTYYFLKSWLWEDTLQRSTKHPQLTVHPGKKVGNLPWKLNLELGLLSAKSSVLSDHRFLISNMKTSELRQSSQPSPRQWWSIVLSLRKIISTKRSLDHR